MAAGVIIITEERCLLSEAHDFLKGLPLSGLKAKYCVALCASLQALLDPTHFISPQEVKEAFLLMFAVCAIKRSGFLASDDRLFDMPLSPSWDEFRTFVFDVCPLYLREDFSARSFVLLKKQAFYAGFESFLKRALTDIPTSIREGDQARLILKLVRFLQCTPVPVLSEVAKDNIISKLYVGMCYGFACVYSVMASRGHSDYWDICLDLIAAWDGTVAGLAKKISIPETYGRFATVGELCYFFLTLSYSFQGYNASVYQPDVLTASGFARIASICSSFFGTSLGFSVVDRKVCFGVFTVEALKDILSFKNVNGRICIISFPRIGADASHAVSFHGVPFGFNPEGSAFYYDASDKLTLFSSAEVAVQRHLDFICEDTDAGRLLSIEIASSDEILLDASSQKYFSKEYIFDLLRHGDLTCKKMILGLGPGKLSFLAEIFLELLHSKEASDHALLFSLLELKLSDINFGMRMLVVFFSRDQFDEFLSGLFNLNKDECLRILFVQDSCHRLNLFTSIVVFIASEEMLDVFVKHVGAHILELLYDCRPTFHMKDYLKEKHPQKYALLLQVMKKHNLYISFLDDHLECSLSFAGAGAAAPSSAAAAGAGALAVPPR